MKCKSDLRRTVLSRRGSLPSGEIARCSALAADHLLSLPEFAHAGTVMFFVSFGSEVRTLDMIERALEQGKRVAAPRADPGSRELVPHELRHPEQDLEPGAHNIKEPITSCPAIPLDEVEVVIVPAAVWGEDGYRVGYGGGYYDRFLQRVPGAVRIGLGLEMQVVAGTPRQCHDLPVDILVTETGIRRFPRQTEA
jgi:5-formyltetrahydrofolate cyclo-ligase